MEKTQLVLALLLTKEVAEHVPDLLRGFFRTTVNFINQNLLGYVRDLLRTVRTAPASPASPLPSACRLPRLSDTPRSAWDGELGHARAEGPGGAALVCPGLLTQEWAEELPPFEA